MKLGNCLNQPPEAARQVQMCSATTGTARVRYFPVPVVFQSISLCLDYEHCPCKNWDEDNQMFCEKYHFEEFYPDFNDCANYLNCSNGCIETVLVGKSVFTFQ